MFDALAEAETDFTLFFRNLAGGAGARRRSLAPLRRAFYAEQPRPRLESWLERYAATLGRESVLPSRAQQSMNGVEPEIRVRNYLAQQAIDALEDGDASVLERLMRVPAAALRRAAGARRARRAAPRMGAPSRRLLGLIVQLVKLVG